MSAVVRLGAEPAAYEVVVCTGLRAGATVAVPATGLLVGRRSDAGLELPDPEVSARHARLAIVGGGLHLLDLDSRNGTFIGGARVRSAALRAGDVVVFGTTIVEVRARRAPAAAAEGEGRAAAVTATISRGDVLGRLLGEALPAQRRGHVLASLYHLGVATANGEEPARLLGHARQLFHDATGAEVVGAAWRDGDGTLVPDAADADAEALVAAASLGAATAARGSRGRVMHVPLMASGRSAGALVLRAAEGASPFDRATLSIVDALADQVAAALAASLLRRTEAEGRRRLEDELGQRQRALVQVRRTLSGAERRVVEAERLAAVAQLAEAVAHEVNNPLGFLLANLDALQARAAGGGDGEEAEMLADCREGARRIQAFVQKLQVLWSGGRGQKAPVVLHDLVAETLRAQRRELEERVEVEALLGAPEAVVRGGEAELVQVVRNLLANVRQAAEESGSDTQPAGRPRVWVTLSLVPGGGPGGRLELVVGGSGAPVEPEQRGRLFEPFGQRGVADFTGLGLWMTRQIVADHGGELLYADAPGGGAQFVVTLPLAS